MQEERKDYVQLFNKIVSLKSRSENTIETYNSCFCKFINEFRGNIKRASNEELIDFVLSQKSPSSMRQMHGVLKLFYKYGLKRDIVKYIPYPDTEKRLRHLPNREQVLKMLDSPPNIKHKLILRLLYATGIRRAELCALRWMDIRREKGENPISIHVRGKGNKDRLIGISKATYNFLIKYCKENNLNCQTDSTDFILGGKKPYSDKSVEVIVRKAALAAGIKTKFTPHGFRYLNAQHQLDAGVRLEDLQNLLGHESPKTTKGYARQSVKKVKPII